MQRNDESERLRRAIKEDNVFLVRRMLGRMQDIRNPDPGPGRYTSLAWAAVCAHEDIYNFLLECGHDDGELTRDVENNTILILLAGLPPDHLNPYHSSSRNQQPEGSTLRMARAYYDRFPFLIDWSNVQGKTALHVAALKGNEQFVRMLCDLRADFDLPDEEGNTPLHYASAWGHISIVQLLIERGCNFAAKNNEGFSASDYAYSNNTMLTLEETARLQFENNKRARKHIYAQARENDSGRRNDADYDPSITVKAQSLRNLNRLRSGSGTSASDSTTDYETSGPSLGSSSYRPPSRPHQSSLSSNSSNQGTHQSRAVVSSSSSSRGFDLPTPTTKSPPSIPPTPLKSTPHQRITPSRSMQQLSTSPMMFPSVSSSSRRQQSIDLALSPVVSRMRQRDADAMAQYMSRNAKVSNEEPSAVNGISSSGSAMSARSGSSVESKPHRLVRSVLRPSMSAAVLRTRTTSSQDTPQSEPVSKSQTSPRLRSTTIDYAVSPDNIAEVKVGLGARERSKPAREILNGVDASTEHPRRV